MFKESKRHLIRILFVTFIALIIAFVFHSTNTTDLVYPTISINPALHIYEEGEEIGKWVSLYKDENGDIIIETNQGYINTISKESWQDLNINK